VSLRDEIIKLLREDETFRMAVAGLLGLDSILNELKKLREDFNRLADLEEKRLEDNKKTWEENFKRWEDNDKKWEMNEKRWIENDKKWEENFKRWAENDKRWEENDKKWEMNEKRWIENDRKWEMNFKRWEENDKKWEEAMKRFSRIELELGASVESQYSRYVLEDLRDEVRARGETVEQRARNIDLDGVEIDLLLTTDKAAYVVEVKVRPTINDVGALLAKVDVVQRNLNKPTVPILTGSYIGGEVEAYAKGKGVRIYRY